MSLLSKLKGAFKPVKTAKYRAQGGFQGSKAVYEFPYFGSRPAKIIKGEHGEKYLLVRSRK